MSEEKKELEAPGPILAGVESGLVSGRSELLDDLFPTLPEHVLRLETTESQYVFNPHALPLRHISFTALTSMMQRCYGLSADLPGSLDKMAAVLGKLGPQSPEEVGDLLLSQGEDIQFKNGLMRTEDGRAINIFRVSINYERINVNVGGPTKAGEHLITEVLPLLWACAGVARSWDELRSEVMVASYGTATAIRLPQSNLGFLSSSFRDRLVKWCAPGGLGSRMGNRLSAAEWQTPGGDRASASIDELELLFERKSDEAFSGERTRLRFSVRARSDHRAGHVTVISELPFEEHLELINDLILILSETDED